MERSHDDGDEEQQHTRVVLWSMTLANAMILVDQTAVPLSASSISCGTSASGLSRCSGS